MVSLGQGFCGIWQRLGRYSFGAVLSALVVVSCPGQRAVAETAYPTKPIHIIVNFAPGGGVDVIARLVAQGLSEAFGQSAVVENRPGAGGIIGAEYVTKAAPDGYTLLVSNGGALHTNPQLVKPKPYELAEGPCSDQRACSGAESSDRKSLVAGQQYSRIRRLRPSEPQQGDIRFFRHRQFGAYLRRNAQLPHRRLGDPRPL